MRTLLYPVFKGRTLKGCSIKAEPRETVIDGDVVGGLWKRRVSAATTGRLTTSASWATSGG